MPRLPVQAPRSGIASMSPVGVTRFRSGAMQSSPLESSTPSRTADVARHVLSGSDAGVEAGGPLVEDGDELVDGRGRESGDGLLGKLAPRRFQFRQHRPP